MARLTRNSYKRKIILFAVFVFISIALISTGFAAWVMSSDAQVDSSGNISVGVVSDSSLKIEITNKTALEAFSFQFEPAAGDNTGRVRVDSKTNLSEALSFTITGTISNVAVLAKNGLTIEMILPDGMQKAIELEYIIAPECASLYDSSNTLVAHPQVITYAEDENGGATFSYELKFTWGDKFKNVNPSLYFDGHTLDSDGKIITGDTTGLSVEDAAVKEILEELRACVYDYYDDLKAASGAEARKAVIEAHKDDKLPTFKVTIKAKAN